MTDVTVVTSAQASGLRMCQCGPPAGCGCVMMGGPPPRTAAAPAPPGPGRIPPSSGVTVLIIWGIRVFFRTTGQGVFHCQRCGGDRRYRRRGGRRFLTLFFIPVIPLNRVGEHVQCTTCAPAFTWTRCAPTAAQMQAALPAGMRAAAAAMLRAGDPDTFPARHRAIQAITGAGEQDYGDAALEPIWPSPPVPGRRAGPGGRPACRPGQGVVPRRGGPDRDDRRPAHRRRARGRARRRRRPGHDPGPGRSASSC